AIETLTGGRKKATGDDGAEEGEPNATAANVQTLVQRPRRSMVVSAQSPPAPAPVSGLDDDDDEAPLQKRPAFDRNQTVSATIRDVDLPPEMRDEDVDDIDKKEVTLSGSSVFTRVK